MIINPYRFAVSGGGGGEGGYQIYRLTMVANNGDSTYTAAARFQLFDTVSGSDLGPTAGGTASWSASLSSSWDGDHLFDGDIDTDWVVQNTSLPAWSQYDFGEQVSLVEYGITQGNTLNRTVKDWEIFGSNNGVDFDLLDSQTDETGWSEGETRIYPL